MLPPNNCGVNQQAVVKRKSVIPNNIVIYCQRYREEVANYRALFFFKKCLFVLVLVYSTAFTVPTLLCHNVCISGAPC